MSKIKKHIYILTDLSKSGGTHTWTINFCNSLDSLNISNTLDISYFVTSDLLTDFESDSTIIINNYSHKFFDKIDPSLIKTLKIYFVMHSVDNPINSYLVNNIEYFNGIICITKQIKKSVEAHPLVSHLHFFLLENFVEPIQLPKQPNLEELIDNKNKNLIIFNFVGRVSPEKNLPMLLYAFDKLKNVLDINNWFLNIWGDTSNVRHFDLLTQIIKKCNLTDNVKFCGFTSDKQKLYPNVSSASTTSSDSYTSYTYTIIPSVYEGSSYAILESLAFGIPVIAGKGIGDNDHQIDNCSNGYLIDFIFSDVFNIKCDIEDSKFLANLNFNDRLKSVGYFEGVVHKNIKNNIMTLNRNIIPLPPIFYNMKSTLFESNIDKIMQILNLAIDKPIRILPQTKINKDTYLKVVKNICC